jgi:hypothetical protein
VRQLNFFGSRPLSFLNEDPAFPALMKAIRFGHRLNLSKQYSRFIALLGELVLGPLSFSGEKVHPTASPLQKPVIGAARKPKKNPAEYLVAKWNDPELTNPRHQP